MTVHAMMRSVNEDGTPGVPLGAACANTEPGDDIFDLEEADTYGNQIDCPECKRIAGNMMICWWVSPPKEEWVGQLRGIPMFELFQEVYNDAGYFPNDDWHGVRFSTMCRIPPCPNEAAWMVMPVPPNMEALETLKEYTSGCLGLVADVTADVWGLTVPTDRMLTAHNEVSTPEAEFFWSDPGVLERSMEVLRLATVITTPWESIVQALKSETGKPVVHVPDNNDLDAFTVTWTRGVYPHLVLRREQLRWGSASDWELPGQ